MPTIGVAGHLCLDLSPRLTSAPSVAPGRLVDIGALRVELGGSVANTGSALAALGARVIPMANVGDDALGALTRELVSDSGLDAYRLTAHPGASSYSLVIEAPGTDRAFWHHTGANDRFDGSDVDLDGLDVLHLGYPSLLPAMLADDGEPLRTLLDRARAADILTSVDLAVVDPSSALDAAQWWRILARMAPATDILSPSLDDLTSALRIDERFSESLVDRLTGELVDAGVGVVAVSAGERGLFVRAADGSRMHVPPVPVDAPLTTNGAGDAASAGFVFGLSLGVALADAAALAVASSATVIAGARPTPEALIALSPRLAPLFQEIPA